MFSPQYLMTLSENFLRNILSSQTTVSAPMENKLSMPLGYNDVRGASWNKARQILLSSNILSRSISLSPSLSSCFSFFLFLSFFPLLIYVSDLSLVSYFMRQPVMNRVCHAGSYRDHRLSRQGNSSYMWVTVSFSTTWMPIEPAKLSIFLHFSNRIFLLRGFSTKKVLILSLHSSFYASFSSSAYAILSTQCFLPSISSSFVILTFFLSSRFAVK